MFQGLQPHQETVKVAEHGPLSLPRTNTLGVLGSDSGKYGIDREEDRGVHSHPLVNVPNRVLPSSLNGWLELWEFYVWAMIYFVRRAQ